MLPSLQSFFRSGFPGRAGWLSAPAVKLQTGLIRRAMLEALGESVPPRFATLKLRIAHADDTEGLWYLRSELMQALAFMHGELRAAAELARITEMFHEMLPRGLASCVAKRRGPSPAT
jgi:hypothetical protein